MLGKPSQPSEPDCAAVALSTLRNIMEHEEYDPEVRLKAAVYVLSGAIPKAGA